MKRGKSIRLLCSQDLIKGPEKAVVNTEASCWLFGERRHLAQHVVTINMTFLGLGWSVALAELVPRDIGADPAPFGFAQ